MTIRAILDTPGPRGQEPKGSVALTFVLNARYLDAFRILIYSLIEQKSLLDLPVIVLSDEEEVFEDDLVNRIADIAKIVTADEKERFSQIVGDKIKDRDRLEWIAKYTFLKWMIFDDFGFERLFYIDADMIALQPLEPLLEMVPDADLVGCPKFPDDFMDRQALDKNAAGLRAFVDTVHKPLENSFNSGIMVIGPRLLTGKFRNDLIDLASERAFASEQRAVWKRLTKDKYRLEYASPYYNFKSTIFDRLHISEQLAQLREIRVMHYIGATKPWLNANAAGFSNELWRKFAAAAAARHPDLLRVTAQA